MPQNILIIGQKVCLRDPIPEDISDYEKWFNPSSKWLKWDPVDFISSVPSQDMEWRILALKKHITGERQSPRKKLEIMLKTGEHIGWVFRYIREDSITTEVGIDICDDRNWGKKYGTEALFLWLYYLFKVTKYPELCLSTWSFNNRMIAICNRLDFKQTNEVQTEIIFQDKPLKRLDFCLIRTDWHSIYSKHSLYNKIVIQGVSKNE